jgi:uridine kinase
VGIGIFYEGKMKLISISGASASGKTSLSRALLEWLGRERCNILSLDNYYKSSEHLSPAERSSINFDHPDAFDIQLLFEQLEIHLKGGSVAIPNYDFTQSVRSPETTELLPKEYLVLEGILTLHWEKIRALSHLTIFVECPEEVRTQRRIERDVRERGRSKESVLKQLEEFTNPMYREFCLPTKNQADLVLDGTQALTELLKHCSKRIEKL